MKIKHFKGRWNNRWYVDILLMLRFIKHRILYFIFDIDIAVTGIYDIGFIYKAQDQDDWRKMYGSKSGAKTETNTEEIVVNKCTFVDGYAYVEQGKYINLPDAIDKNFTVYDKVVKKIPVKAVFSDPDFTKGKVAITTMIKPTQMLPVTPWAGGDKMNTADYFFKMKTKVIFKQNY